MTEQEYVTAARDAVLKRALGYEAEEVEYHAPCGKCMMVAEDCKYNCKKGRK